MKHIRLALSGGGHRATVFSLGALLYLVDSSRNRDVQTITSVSGGSLTNAYLSLLATPFNKMSANEFRKHAASFSNQIAGSPVMWKLAWVTYLLPWTIWLVPVPQFWIRFAVFIALICIWAFQIGPRSRGTLWGWSGTWLYLGLLVIPAIVAIPVSWGIIHQGWRILTIDIALIAGVLLALSRRHIVAGMAFGATIHSPDANAQRHLSDGFSTGVRHVFCATEAHVGRHIFFSRDFVFTPDFGLGVPGPPTTLRCRSIIGQLPRRISIPSPPGQAVSIL